MAKLLALPAYRQQAKRIRRQPRLFQDAEEVFKAGIVLLGLGLGARIVAMGVPAAVRETVTTLVFWAVAVVVLLFGVLLFQTARKTWRPSSERKGVKR